MVELLCTLLGVVAGCLSLVPGFHAAALIAGLLPLLGAHGLAGSCFVVAAAGSAMMVQALSKTFQPATKSTLHAATPEVKLAYSGRGLTAIAIQNFGTEVGACVALLCCVPLFLLAALFPKDMQSILRNVSSWIQLPLMLWFTWTLVKHAHNRGFTLLVVGLASVFGFYSMNRSELMGNPSSLAPLLTGIFVLPIGLSIISHKGKVEPLPAQLSAEQPKDFEHNWIGPFGGMITAIVSGVGASSAVASFASSSTEEEYLQLQALSEGANNTLALLLLVLIGAGHSSTAVAVQEMSGKLDLVSGLAVLLAGGVGITLGSKVTTALAPHYAQLITRINAKHIALFVLGLSSLVLLAETGMTGLIVAGAAGALGLAARTSMVPNQALLMVLSGPVLIQKLGLARELALVLGIAH
jgi:TctA family transporter